MSDGYATGISLHNDARYDTFNVHARTVYDRE